MTTKQLIEDVRHRADQVGQSYAGGQDRPLAGYATALATYTLAGGTLFALAARRSRRTGADRVDTKDLVLLTVATHRIARTLTKDAVTSPLRAPFVRYRGPGSPSEVNEELTPATTQDEHAHAVGELLTCPFCLGQWVATVLVGGHVLAPRWTRLVTTTFTAVAGADVLQFLYDALARWEQRQPA